MYLHVNPDDGWLEAITGCMFSGKTEELIRRLRRAEIAKQNVITFKPRIDTRTPMSIIKSHGGVSTVSTFADSPAELRDIAMKSSAKVVGIDEVQFFDPSTIVDVVEELVGSGKRVIVSGLDLDYRGQPFEGVADLVAKAEFTKKMAAVCTVCGARATRSQRLTNSGDRVLVGGQAAYEARCRRHWKPEPVFSTHGQMEAVED